MTTRFPALQWLCFVALAASTVACGNSMSATGPSGTSSNGAVITGRVTMAGSAAASVATTTPLALWVLPVAPLANSSSGTVTVTIVGTGASTTIDGNGSFTLDNVPPGSVQLHFQGRGADATLTISGIEADDQISIAVTLNGNSARLDKSEKSSGGGNGNGNLVNGRIDSIDAGSRTLRVEGTTVLVTASTTIRHGNKTFGFTDLRVGDHIQVKGSRNGSTVMASEIKVESDGNGADDDDDDEADRVVFRGTVSLLTGLCPGLTMTVTGTRVVSNATTQFEDVTCATLRNDMVVEVTGLRRSDGSVLATKINREDSDQTELRGTVSLLVGVCPGLTFTVGSTQVVTNAATQFQDVSCATLTNTMLVEVTGIRRSDGSVLASKVDRN